LRNLINKPHIEILIVICEIHQFHRHFFHMVFFSFVHWRFVFSKIRRLDRNHLFFDRTFAFGLRTKNSKT